MRERELSNNESGEQAGEMINSFIFVQFSVSSFSSDVQSRRVLITSAERNKNVGALL